MIVVLSVLVNFFLAAYNLLLPFSNQIFPDIAIGLYGSFLTAEAFDGIIGALIIGISKKDLPIQKLMTLLGISGTSLSVCPIVYLLL
ncbi:macrolide ABC transporter permease, partial [Staphylococcus simulans]